MLVRSGSMSAGTLMKPSSSSSCCWKRTRFFIWAGGLGVVGVGVETAILLGNLGLVPRLGILMRVPITPRRSSLSILACTRQSRRTGSRFAKVAR